MAIMDIFEEGEEKAKSQCFYHSLPKSFKEDVVADTYQIHTDRPINELGNQFCRYYFATHMESEKEYFAIILENSFRAPVNELSILKNAHCPAINSVLAYSLVKLGISKKYSLCAIVEAYRPDDNLQHYIEQNGKMNSDQIEHQLMPAINAALSYCESHKINMGHICPSNILIDRDGNIKIREFFTSLPSFNQQQAYLAPEIADAMPHGRRVFGLASDIYSVGISMYFAISGSVPQFSTHEPKLFNASRIESGTYSGFIATKRIPRRIKTLLAWTLQDNPEERWTNQEISEWHTNSREFSLPKPKGSRNYTTLFASHNYSNPLALVSAMYALYDEGTKFCRDDLFLKWVQKVKGRAEYVEDFVHMHLQNQTVRGMTSSEMEESFFKILKQLNPTSTCIKLKDFCITIASIPDIIYEALHRESTIWEDHLTDIFKNNYYGMLEDKHYYTELPVKFIEKLSNIATIFKDKFRNESICDLIYQFDIYVPCQSNVVISDFVLSLEDLLVSLDKVASNTPNRLNIDNQIVSFIKSRIKMSEKDEDNIVNLENFVKSSKLLKGIAYLATAQENAPDIKIPHLASIVAQKLIEWINENIYNSKLKNVITSELAELSGNGILSQMLYVVSNPKLFHNDNKGYKSAYKEMQIMDHKIKRLSDPNENYLEGVALGQKATVLLSYLLCMVVALILVM